MRHSKMTKIFLNISLVLVVKDKITYGSACMQYLELSFTH